VDPALSEPTRDFVATPCQPPLACHFLQQRRQPDTIDVHKPIPTQPSRKFFHDRT